MTKPKVIPLSSGLAEIARHLPNPRRAGEPRRTREQWLRFVLQRMRPVFAQEGSPLPRRVLVSVGIPTTRGGSARGGHAIGQCFGPQASQDGATQVFITPEIADTHQVLATLVHELVHAAVGVEAGHGPIFKDMALRVGLTGRMTSTTGSDALNAVAGHFAHALGAFPGSKLTVPKKHVQPTRYLKMQCADCGGSLRITRESLEKLGGSLMCGAGHELELADMTHMLKLDERRARRYQPRPKGGVYTPPLGSEEEGEVEEEDEEEP